MKRLKAIRGWAAAGSRKGVRVSAVSRSYVDLAVILVTALMVFVVSAEFDIFNRVISWIYDHDTWQLDEVFTVSIYLVLASGIYAWRRHRELIEQMRRRERAEAEEARLIPELENALADVSKLKKLLPLCSSCKRVRDDKGYWTQVEEYVESHFRARFDDGLCPDCARKIYGKRSVTRS